MQSAPNDNGTILLDKTGRCDCSQAHTCVLGRAGAAYRCTKPELEAAGFKTRSADYHSDFEHISRSMLATFAGRNGHSRYHEAYVLGKGEPFNETDSTRIGTGAHAITLDDVKGIENCLMIPERVLGKGGKRVGNAYKKFKLKHRDKNLLTPDQWQLCERISKALHQKIGGLIKHPAAVREQEYRWMDRGTGLKFRIKTDIEIPGDQLDDGTTLCIDIKTARSIDGFRSEVRRRKLWLQDCQYTTGLEHKYQKPVRFLFAVVEKHGDHDVEIIELDDEDGTQSRAMSRYVELKKDLAECYETGVWDDPGADNVKKIGLSERDFE